MNTAKSSKDTCAWRYGRECIWCLCSSSYHCTKVLMHCASRATGGSHTWVHTPSTSPGKGKGAGRSYSYALVACRRVLFFLSLARCARSAVYSPASAEQQWRGIAREWVNVRRPQRSHTVCCVFYRALIAPRGSVRIRTWALTSLSRDFYLSEPCCPPQVHGAVHRGTLIFAVASTSECFASTSWCQLCVPPSAVRSGARDWRRRVSAAAPGDHRMYAACLTD